MSHPAPVISSSLRFSKEQERQFERYITLLSKWSSLFNLTGIRDAPALREQLILRSLRALVAIDTSQAATVIDVGTGAGIPGLILKIAAPDLTVTLLDATAKKIEFVQMAIRELGLPGVVAIQGRAEELGHRAEYRESFDFAVARAVGPLSELAELLLPFLRIGGKAIALKQTNVEDEAVLSRFATTELGGSNFELQPASSPGSSASDTIAISRKLEHTPARFPRRVGVPHKHPLRAPRSAR